MQLFVERLTARSILTLDEQSAVLDLPVHRHKIRAKHDFVHVNEETSSSCFVASGVVARFAQTVHGARQITAFHIAGDMADLHSTVRPLALGGLNALCDATILKIPHVAIRTMSARYPAIGEALWRDCMLDAAVLTQWVVNVGRHAARTRLAHVFCEMAIRDGGDLSQTLECSFPITQEQLGDATAMTPIHVNRSLRALRDEGLVTFVLGRVRIHNWIALARVGEFDASYLVADTGANRQGRLVTEI